MSINSQIDVKNHVTTEQSENLADNFIEIPSCTIEDVDKALFDLFDKELPLLYTHRNHTNRIPIVFATGERFALIARKKPLRDRSNALILPVISIMRSSLQFGNEYGAAVAPDIRQVIKRQLSSKDSAYQRLVNKLGLQNSDDLVSPNAFIDQSTQQGVNPGRIASRRSGAGTPDPVALDSGELLKPNLGNNIYEIYEIPPPVFFTATYEVTIWTQYMQEMNNTLAVLGTEAHMNAKKSYRIETSKGYYFVAYIDDSVGNGSNFEDFSEEERLVRTTLTIKIPGYFLGNSYKGSPNKIRKFVSSPVVSFEASFARDADESRLGIPTGNPNDLMLENLRTVDDPAPGQFIGGVASLVGPANTSALVGGIASRRNPVLDSIQSPFSSGGKGSVVDITVTKTGKTTQGETTYRQIK